MTRSRSSISKARSYKEIGEFWDTHDLSDYWDETTPVEFEVDMKINAESKEARAKRLAGRKAPTLKAFQTTFENRRR
jgi:hypothetical protein